MGFRVHALPLIQEIRRHLPDRPTCYLIGTQDCSFTYREVQKRYPSQFRRAAKEIENMKDRCDINTLYSLFDFESVKTVDMNDRADIRLDLTRPVPEEYREKADLVCDFGTLEHIFDVKEAIENMNRLLKTQGIILHMSPVSFYQHGFYNFNPLLFDTLYSLSGYEPILRTMNVTIYNPLYVIDTQKLSGWVKVFFSMTNKIFRNAILYRYNLPYSGKQNTRILSFFHFWAAHFRIPKNLMYCCAYRKCSSELKIPYDVWP